MHADRPGNANRPRRIGTFSVVSPVMVANGFAAGRSATLTLMRAEDLATQTAATG
jgi:hypothetical protein